MKQIRHILYCLFFLTGFCILRLHAQAPLFRTLDYSLGLPSNTVYSIMQDSKGYIWIAHDKGLSRYNGVNFKNYADNMLQSRAVSNLEEDYLGRVWCQNFSGEIFYTEGDSLSGFHRFGAVGNYTNINIFQKDKIVTTRNRMLVEYNLHTGKQTGYQMGGKQVLAGNVYNNGKNIYAFSSSAESVLFFNQGKLSKEIKLPESLHAIICHEYLDRFYFLPNTGADKFAIWQNGEFRFFQPGFKALTRNMVIINNQIWLSTSEGIYRYSLNFAPLDGGVPLMPELNVSKIIRDHEGGIWVSTLNKGVVYFSNLQVTLLKLNLPQQAIVSMSYFSSTDRVILGTGNNRLFEFDPYTFSTSLIYDFKVRHDVTTVYNDISNDLIWVASNRMYSIRPGTKAIFLEASIALKDIVYLGGSTYALAVSDGIGLFTSEDDTLDNEFSINYLNRAMKWQRGFQLLKGSEGRAKCVEYDRETQTLYGANFKGLFYWSPGKKGQITDSKGDPIYASDLLVQGNTVYAVTYGGSLLMIRGNKVIRTVAEFPGLAKKSISRVAIFDNNLWLLLENAIVKYNIKTDKFTVIRPTDGLPDTEIKDIMVINNQVYLATRMGIVTFPENIQNVSVIPRLVIEDVYVNKVKKAAENGEYELSADEKNLEINFSVLSYRSTGDIQTFYSINNNDWIAAGSRATHITLAGLAPGNYRIRLKAVKPDGSEIVLDKIPVFHIASPIYVRWWFILLGLMALGFLGYSFMRFRLNELRKEAEFKTAKERMEKELQMSTLTSIKSQMNPHFVFNALNTVQSYIFTNDKDNAIDYLNKFSDLTRMILDMSNREMIPLSEEIRALNLYLELENKRFEDNFHYVVKVNENVNPELIQIPSMLIQPYVENAIKHGLLHKQSERKLRVEFLRESKTLVVFIDDNGVGRKRSQEIKLAKSGGHKSFATEANKKRLQLLNRGRENTIDIEYLDKTDGLGKPDGTMVILAIPINF